VAKKKKKASSKDKSFKITPKKLIRWAIFLFLIYLLLSYLPQNTAFKPNLPVLGDTDLDLNLEKQLPDYIEKLSPEKKEILETSQKEIQSFADKIKDSLNGFPQKQINQIKKEIVTQIYQDIVEEW